MTPRDFFVLIGGEDSESSFPYHYIGGMYLAVLRGKLNHVLFNQTWKSSVSKSFHSFSVWSQWWIANPGGSSVALRLGWKKTSFDWEKKVQILPFNNFKERYVSTVCKSRVIFSGYCFIYLSDFVITPNSNTFSDWKKTCHVSCVKTH